MSAFSSKTDMEVGSHGGDALAAVRKDVPIVRECSHQVPTSIEDGVLHQERATTREEEFMLLLERADERVLNLPRAFIDVVADLVRKHIFHGLNSCFPAYAVIVFCCGRGTRLYTSRIIDPGEFNAAVCDSSECEIEMPVRRECEYATSCL